MNIDGATAAVYANSVPPELARGLFVLSWSVGILAHAWEQSQRGERIRGPMPRSVLPHYIGPKRPAGGTVERVETDADGATYEVHVTKADGMRITGPHSLFRFRPRSTSRSRRAGRSA